MSPRIEIRGICEQDIDLFMLEECASNQPFLDWLLSQVPGWPKECRELLTGARSIDHADGESDLELTVMGSAGHVGRLLVENKLAAGFQPHQLERYRGRAAMYVERGECAHAAVILLAPRCYAGRAAGKVDAVVSYEDVEAWLATSEPDPRIGYKLRLIRSALAKSRRGYNPESDGAVSEFWHRYWQQAEAEAPQLGLEQPGAKPAGAGFVWFSPSGLPENLNICHKLTRGFVDLHFPEWGGRAHALKVQLGPHLDADMSVARAGKSAAIRMRVPALNIGRPFEGQLDAVRKGLDAARRLCAWADRSRARIRQVYAKASGS